MELRRSALLVFWSPTGDQPTACTLALWWLTFGPTGEKGWDGFGMGGVLGGTKGSARLLGVGGTTGMHGRRDG